MALLQGITRRSKISYNVLRTVIRTHSDPGPKALGKKILSKVMSQDQNCELPVETNAEKLVNYVCGTSLYEEIEEIVKIKPDSEYPSWLWTLHTGKPKELSELDPNTIEYWKRVRKLGMQTKKRLLSLRSDKRDYK